MNGLTKRELVTVTGVEQRIYDVVIKLAEAGVWQMEVVFPSQVFQVETQRGTRKTWRTLEGAVDFARETCPTMHELRVVFDHKLTLSSLMEKQHVP